MFTKKKPNRVSKFLNATHFSPLESTLIKAINNASFATCPGLNKELIAANLPKSEATALGHLDQRMENIGQQKGGN